MFRAALLRWYDREKRDLPWRRTKDPYRIWVSEIMLQQTRVGAVLEHYRRFFERFPSISNLAAASTNEVLAAWSGLGYYRRARNLHAAVQKVIGELAGDIPRTADGLRNLPGIGRYTAAAIASIAFNEQCAVLDGNVERVLERISGSNSLSKSELWGMAEDLLSSTRPGDFNQAVMELGATLCLPAQPRCLLCPIHRWCQTKGSHPKKNLQHRRLERVDLLLIQNGGRVKMVRRSKSETVMPGMWELPTLVTLPPNGVSPAVTLKHAIMNTDYQVKVWTGGRPRGRTQWCPLKDVQQLPITGLTRKILRRMALI
ncbi:MAG TPA: A/G-specific adenine glycosylase [Terriglobales bacterium]|nr:A/G-specific adenine glycosylase [Terriglobales bacterium]